MTMRNPLIVAVVASVLFYLLVAEYPSWGKPAGFRRWWENKPTLSLNAADKANVLTRLLEENREEIRFWQDHLFSISFVFSAAVLGIVAFAVQAKTSTRLLRYVCAVGCFILCIFYLLFVRFADDAISLNDHDLIGIQYALKLSTPGEYLQGNQPESKTIYGEGYPSGHPHIKHLVRLNVLLVIGSVLWLLYTALRGAETGEGASNRKPESAPGRFAPGGVAS
jgi:hypothetical protein